MTSDIYFLIVQYTSKNSVFPPLQVTYFPIKIILKTPIFRLPKTKFHFMCPLCSVLSFHTGTGFSWQFSLTFLCVYVKTYLFDKANVKTYCRCQVFNSRISCLLYALPHTFLKGREQKSGMKRETKLGQKKKDGHINFLIMAPLFLVYSKVKPFPGQPHNQHLP